jgi:hypothetical protein
METIIEIEDADLTSFIYGQLGLQRQEVYKLRVCIDGGTVKFKVNESTWSPPLGHLDPMCRAAARQRVQIASAKERAGEA